MLIKGLEGQPRSSNHTSLLENEMIFTFLLQSVVWPSQGLDLERPKVIIRVGIKRGLIFSCMDRRTGTPQPSSKCLNGSTNLTDLQTFIPSPSTNLPTLSRIIYHCCSQRVVMLATLIFRFNIHHTRCFAYSIE